MTRLLFLFLAIISILIAGCSDDPSSIASGLLPGGDIPLLTVDTLFSTAHSTMAAIVPSRSSDRLLLGNRGATEAWTLIRFLQFPDSLSEVTITSAAVELTASYHFGSDSLAPISFTVHKAVSSWLGDSLTCDSLKQSGYYFDASPLQTVSSVSIPDTGTFRFALPDTNLIRQWIRSTSDTSALNEGFVLKPTNASVIKGFWSFGAASASSHPRLIIDYIKNGVAGTYTHSVGNARYSAAAPFASVATDTTRIFVQNGTSYRGLLSFDISSIRPGAIVNQAYLDVTMDPLRSDQTGLAVDSLFSALVSQTGPIVSDTYQLSSVSSSAGGTKTYSFNIRSYVQTWLALPSLPRRVALLGFNELGTLDIIALNGTGAANNLRPRLRVVYSTTKP